MLNTIILSFNSFFEKNHAKIINISLLITSIYFFLRSIDCLFLIPFPIGDERVYVKEFNYFLKNGLIESIRNGMSIFFMLLSYFIHILSDMGEFSLRIAGLISTLSLIIYFYFRLNFSNLNDKKIFFILLLFLIPTTGASIHATNDSMFFLFLIIYIFELFIIDRSIKGNKTLILLSSFIMIATRPVVIVYTGIIIISFFCFSLIYRTRKNIFFLKEIIFSLLIGFFATAFLSIPNFLNNNYELSYSDKSIYNERGVTWTEWVFHSQKIGNSSKRFGLFSPMLKWQEALKYKLEYGDKSLPDSYPEYLTHDLGFIFRRTISSLFEITIISIRYVGLLLIVFPFFIIKKYLNNDFDNKMLISFISIIGILTWSIIWPGLVQHRWLFPFYVIILYCILDYKLKFHYNIPINILNLLIINFIICWYFWKVSFFEGI